MGSKELSGVKPTADVMAVRSPKYGMNRATSVAPTVQTSLVTTSMAHALAFAAGRWSSLDLSARPKHSLRRPKLA